MKNLLVTGGAGFIGSNFVHFVRKNMPKIHITVLDALTYAGNIENLRGLIESQGGVEFIHGSINDQQLVDSIMARVDTVVNFAAESHNDRAIAQPEIFFETNVLGTLTLLQSAQKYGIRFHHISTDEVFGDTPIDSEEKFTEESPYKPSSPYAASKAASDHLVRAWVRTYGLQATISNCSNNYGPYQHIEKFIPRAITNALSGLPVKLYGTGDAIRDWIHAEDQCAAIVDIIERGRVGETYLIGANCTLSNRAVVEQLSEAVHDVTGRSVWVQQVKDRPGADRRYSLDATKIRRELGWEPQHTNFGQELRKLVQWYASNSAWWNGKKSAVESEYAQNGQ